MAGGGAVGTISGSMRLSMAWPPLYSGFEFEGLAGQSERRDPMIVRSDVTSIRRSVRASATIVGQRADEHCQISALPLDFGLTLMIACQDAVLSASPAVTEIAGVTRRRCTTTCTAMLIGADNEHRSSPAERDVGTRWALIGGGASLTAAVYTQRHQDRLQRVARETTKREQVYADFIMDASKLLLNAYVREELTLSVDEQHLVGLANRMRLFAPPTVIHEAEAVIRGLIEILLKPSIDLRKLAIEELSKNSNSDLLLPFSLACRADLDQVYKPCVEFGDGNFPHSMPLCRESNGETG